MNFRSKIIRITAAVCGLALTAAVLTGCGLKPDFGVVSGSELENPKQTILDFVDTMKSEEFDLETAERANSFIGNYSTMGFEKFGLVDDDVIEIALTTALRRSYGVEFADPGLEPVPSPYQGTDMYISGKQAFVDITFTSLSIDLISEPLAEVVAQVGHDRMYEGETFDTSEDALALVEEVFPSVFDADGDLTPYCVQKEMTVELTFTDDGWKIVMSDELYKAMLGQ